MAEITMTENITLPATAYTPAINFDFAACQFLIKGESYPENASAFYRPLLTETENWLKENNHNETPRVLNILLNYFNSSSTKMLFTLLELFNTAAKAGATVELHWYYDAEDDISQEFGQDLQLDFPAMRVVLHEGMDRC